MALVRAEYDFKLRVLDTPSLAIDGLTVPPLFYETDTATDAVLDSTTSPPATIQWQDTRTLTASADTIDLTALTEGGLSAAKDCTGLRVRLVKIYASVNNTASIAVEDASSNGYRIFGSSAGRVDIPVGGIVMFYCHNGDASVPIISSTAKNIGVSSSDADASYEIQIVAG